jgi:imidazolonepropionase-like amidohydrolase
MTRTVLRGGAVFDGTGSDPRRADVLIDGDHIAAVGTGLDGDLEIDVSGRTVLPGFFDCHVHLTVTGIDVLRRISQPFSYEFFAATRHMRDTLAAGVTTVRDAGGADAGLRQAQADGLIAGPRVLISVNIIGQTGGHSDGWLPSGLEIPLCLPHPGRPSGIADGPDEMRRVVRRMLRAGADVIKVCATGGVLSPGDDPRHAQLDQRELETAVAEAGAVGRPVLAHAQGTAGIKNALAAGVRSIEHGIYLDDETIEMMLATGAWLVPTLIAPVAVVEAAEAGAQLAPRVVEKARAVMATHAVAVRRAAAAGVRIAMGTDSGVGPHGTNLRELELMAGCGMSPAAVLHAATGSAAELCGLQDIVGTIRPGLIADLLVVDGNPYELGGLRERIMQIWQSGQRVDANVRRAEPAHV